MSGPRTVGRRLVDGLLAVVGLLLLAFLGTVAWLTRVPEAPILERATRWPVVAPMAQSFRDAYLPPSPAPSTDRGSTINIVERTIRHEPPRPPRAHPNQPRWAWVPEGAVLRTEATASSRELGVVDGYHRLPRLTRRGDWFQVWSGGRAAWVHLPGYRADGDDGPPFGDGVTPPGPLPGRTPDPEALEAALARLDPELRRRVTVGPYALHTDLTRTEPADAALLRRLDGVAARVEAAYAARYGVEPIDRPRAEIVLYADSADYRALRDAVHDLPRVASSGHLAAGVVALALDSDREQTVSTLVHELVHLLNRRAIGPALPPWLDEGMADELAGAAIDPDGRLRPGEPSGRRIRVGDRIVLTGARASAWTVRAMLDREPPDSATIRRVLALEREAFLDGDPRPRYDLAASWIRFLLADDTRADAFRAFLGDVSRGGDPSLDALAERIEGSTGEGWPELERAFERHVRLRAAALDAWVAEPEPPSEPIVIP